MTQLEKEALRDYIISYAIANSQGINDLPDATNISGISYFPVIQEDNGNFIAKKAAISLLQPKLRSTEGYIQYQDLQTLEWVNIITAEELASHLELSGYVNTTVDQIINGIKTFNNSPTVPNPTTSQQVTNKDYVDTGLSLKVNKTSKIISGNGLTGGGDLSSDLTLNIESANDAITVNADNIQLNIIDNLTTTSTTKPLSANQGKILNDKATQIETYLNKKVDEVAGKGLSTNDYTTEEKDKLNNIEYGAQANISPDWDAEIGFAQILNKPDIDGSINSALVPLKAKTDKIVTTGIGTQFLANDGTYKNVNAFANILEDEEFIGEYNVAQSVYNLYQTTFELSILPKVLGASTIFKVSDRPLGFNVYLEVKVFSVSPVLKSAFASFTQKGYEIVRVFVDEDLCTKIEVKCLENTSVDYKAVVQLQYVRDFGDILEFTVTVPSGVDTSAVSLEFPKLKYNKKNVASLTVDDSYSIYNNFFAVVNKRWVDDEKMSFWTPTDTRDFVHHLDMNVLVNGKHWTKTNGYYPSKFLEYSDGAGVKHRFACSVAAWCWDLGKRNEDVGIMWPWISAKEARYMHDFGYTLNYHDIQGIGDWQKANGTTLAPKNEFNKMLKVDADMFQELTDRTPKIMQGPNGDPNYIYMSRTCPIIQYNMEISNRNTDSVCVPFKPFNNPYLLDYKPGNHLVQRFFYNTSYNFEGWKNAIIAQMALAEANRAWQILGMHRMTVNPDENGTTMAQAITALEASQGVSGNDQLWFPSIDEVYEYWFMTYYGKTHKTVNGQNIKFKVYAPCGKNFWFRSISCLLSGISNITGVSVASSDNCFGTSYAMSDGKLLVNLDFNSDLIEKAEKYVSILEANPQKEYAYDDAQYFVQMLKPGVKEAYQSRIDALVSKPVLNSITVNSGAASTESQTVSVVFSYSAGAPSHYMLSENPDMSGGVWADFVSNPSFVLSSGYGAKTLYAKLKNGFGETSVMSDAINYTEPVLNLTSLLINNGDVSTSNPSVILTFGYVGTATHYMVSDSASFTGASWEAFASNPTFILYNATFGAKSVYAKLKNATIETAAVSNTITLVNPNEIALNSVSINNGDENTASLNVSVSLGITNTPTHYKIGETADLSAIAWQAFNASPLSYTLSGYGIKTVYVQLKNATSTSAVLSDSITAVQPVTLNSILINNADVSTDNKILSVALNYSGGTPTHYMVSENSEFTGGDSWIPFISSPILYTLADVASGNKTVYVKLKNMSGETGVSIDTIELLVKQRTILFGNVVSPGTVEGVGYVNSTLRANTNSPTIYDLGGISFCFEQGQYPAYFQSQLNVLRTKWGITSEVTMNSTYWDTPSLPSTGGKYPNSIIVNGLQKNVTLYGAILPDTTYQSVKYLTGVPIGTYTVKLLLSSLATSPGKYPNILRVNNETISISDKTNISNNNTYWYEFNNVAVGSDGYMLIAQYPSIMLTASYFRIEPIVLIEITKTS